VFQEIVELAGYTSRVGDMLDVFEDTSRGKYQRTVVTTSESKHSSKNNTFRMEFRNGQPVVKGNADKCQYSTVIASCTHLFLILPLLTATCCLAHNIIEVYLQHEGENWHTK
jgi:hypothetical protein